MMTGNVVGRRLTMNGSYGSVGSARAAAKKGALECQTMECSLFGQKTASVCPVYGENGCRIAADLLSAAVFVCGTENAHAQVLLGVSAFAAKNGGKVRDGLCPLSL